MTRLTELDRPKVDSPLQPLSNALEQIFTSQQEENQTLRARRIMGNLVSEIVDEELEIFVTEFQYLIDEWLDCFEKQVFGGKTLKQVLGQE